MNGFQILAATSNLQIERIKSKSASDNTEMFCTQRGLGLVLQCFSEKSPERLLPGGFPVRVTGSAMSWWDWELWAGLVATSIESERLEKTSKVIVSKD